MSGDARASKALPRMVVVFGDETLSKMFISRQKLFYCSVRVHAVGGGFLSDYAYCGGLSAKRRAGRDASASNRDARRRRRPRALAAERARAPNAPNFAATRARTRRTRRSRAALNRSEVAIGIAIAREDGNLLLAAGRGGG